MLSGTFLKNMRDKRNMTQNQLAKMIGVMDDHISKLERNERRPTTKIIIAYSKIFKVPVQKIFLNTLRPFWTKELDDNKS